MVVCNHLIGLWEILTAAAQHPFVSLGGAEISAVFLFKTAALLALAMLLLRRVRLRTQEALEQKTRLAPGTAASITTLGYYAAAALAVLIILGAVGINLTQLTVIFGALGVGIGFGLQNILNNFVSGIILLAEQVIKVGDIVNLRDDLTGEVKKIAIRYTVIRTANGDDVIVPNSEFVSGRVNSWTFADDWRRLTVPFSVVCGSDPDTVVRLAAEAAREVEITREDEAHPVLVFFEGFGDSGLNFSLRVWCRMRQLRPGTGLRSDYYFVLHRKLAAAGVELPFRTPQQSRLNAEALNTATTSLPG